MGTRGRRDEEGVMEHTTHLYGNGRVEVELSSAEEVQTTATTTEGMTGVCLKRNSALEDAPMNVNGQRVLMMAKPAK